jgi:hypothetical protein
MEEREAADQILLASHDAKLCCILSIGVYLEVLGRFDASHIKTDNPLFGDATNGHHATRNGLDFVFKNPKFCKRKHGNPGTLEHTATEKGQQPMLVALAVQEIS